MSTQETSSQELPAWFQEYQKAYKSGTSHLFLVTGDVYGHHLSGRSNERWLAETMATNRNIVLFYERARGFSFLDEQYALSEDALQMRKLAVDLMGGSTAQVQTSLAAKIAGATNANASDPYFSSQMSVIEALRLIERLIRKREATHQIAVIIEKAELICPAGMEKGMMPATERDILSLLFSWSRSQEIGKTENPIFLLASKGDELNQDLRSSESGAKMLTIPLPDKAERLAYLTRYLGEREAKKKPIPLLGGLTIERLANGTAGLNLRHLEDICLLGYPAGITPEMVTARKNEIIASEFSAIAEMVDPLPGGFADLGGMDHLIEWAKGDLIEPLRAGSKDAPKGVILLGPPGTGKTFSVRAIAQEVGFNCVALKPEKIVSKYVGESERNLRAFFDFARALAPVLIFVDELDQSDLSSRGGGENPVARNLFGMMLQFMSDPSLYGKVVVFVASNRPDLIDSALLRSGRMDAILPVLLPDEAARASILRVQTHSQDMTITATAIEAAAKGSENYSAADLAAIVKKAKKLARRDARPLINEQDIQATLRYLRPNTPQTADYYTNLALLYCNDTELLPPQYATRLDNRPALREQVAGDARKAGIGPILTASEERTERSSW